MCEILKGPHETAATAEGGTRVENNEEDPKLEESQQMVRNQSQSEVEQYAVGFNTWVTHATLTGDEPKRENPEGAGEGRGMVNAELEKVEEQKVEEERADGQRN